MTTSYNTLCVRGAKNLVNQFVSNGIIANPTAQELDEARENLMRHNFADYYNKGKLERLHADFENAKPTVWRIPVVSDVNCSILPEIKDLEDNLSLAEVFFTEQNDLVPEEIIESLASAYPELSFFLSCTDAGHNFDGFYTMCNQVELVCRYPCRLVLDPDEKMPESLTSKAYHHFVKYGNVIEYQHEGQQ